MFGMMFFHYIVIENKMGPINFQVGIKVSGRVENSRTMVEVMLCNQFLSASFFVVLNI